MLWLLAMYAVFVASPRLHSPSPMFHAFFFVVLPILSGVFGLALAAATESARFARAVELAQRKLDHLRAVLAQRRGPYRM